MSVLCASACKSRWTASFIADSTAVIQAEEQVALIERHLFGGTCVNTGCMPTKTLVASAYAAHLARRAAEYGVVIGDSVGIDMKRVQQRAATVTLNARTNVEVAALDAELHGHSRPCSVRICEHAASRRSATQRVANLARFYEPLGPVLFWMMHMAIGVMGAVSVVVLRGMFVRVLEPGGREAAA